MADDTYQGWANRETWALMLWVNNEQGLYEMYREMVRKSGIDAVQESLELNLDSSHWIDEWGVQIPRSWAEMAREVGSLWRVDWDEVNSALLED